MEEIIVARMFLYGSIVETLKVCKESGLDPIEVFEFVELFQEIHQRKQTSLDVHCENLKSWALFACDRIDELEAFNAQLAYDEYLQDIDDMYAEEKQEGYEYIERATKEKLKRRELIIMFAEEAAYKGIPLSIRMKFVKTYKLTPAEESLFWNATWFDNVFTTNIELL